MLAVQPCLAADQLHAALADPLQRGLPSCSLTRRARAATAGYITSGGADRATPYTFSFSKPLR